MPTPPLSQEAMREALEAVKEHGSVGEAAKALGKNRSTINNRYNKALAAGIDPSIQDAANAVGVTDTSTIGHFWRVVSDGEGGRWSVHIRNPDSGETMSLADMVKASIEEALGDNAPVYAPRPAPVGEYLLVVDLADVHFLKLCVASETGYTYNRDVARHRVIEGTKALLRAAEPYGVGRVLFVLGNDILHVDKPKPETTNGTSQDTDGSIFQGFSDAFAALIPAIEACADVAPVDLVHCMSNHDKMMGWALSQKIGAWFRNHPNIRSTDYNLSTHPRKYYGFGNNAFQIHHADGAKEEKLYALFVTEARELIGKCKNLYSLCHHLHHKIRKKRGVDVFQTEKDHIGMTAISVGSAQTEGTTLDVEYVRSPSAPDSWHMLHGYVNRQAVECFLYHPQDGIKSRYTEWF